ncbi:UDP-N-acetylmuramoylalanine--D-glutamate ligase [Candidatus Kryptonium thompsonii]|uniref:UDP-N-acetylmuramoylalanine--D-glutamate ligase n=1 Tax=Candidatus Kryptonium thompsonii TaxID=1633631 RepID=A0A0P1MAW4_9BACT|nr:UDP-N-acetylmuramoyl-L-alanine--D-glutamate ligase [Candidatus Kryptonium thompsoni]CUS76763.1 UDP-N-acetylmuramoylalanine--D-glutamate ligase [Candidatus Kryptonium thompsoni]CUS78155.1 UDP-N-acetylmuramoylalanine--D-glutamate ligase [Candidatus Kryptonium thompsoni]CUS79256.1 UDP-N-acetylmuramoylalanine--D-glutamate ligase [Candidatus Kryptonium thompsoni]CUS86942.1 UDP-N-acetylmuramoylalanine--D-glutamate ligase [Candidatus Kryptonium thompsoni]CUS90168.1 UDP-N-acetylmuramoylalanine--D-g
MGLIVQNIEGKKVTVIGGARSGLAVARLLKKMGADVFISDMKKPEEIKYVKFTPEELNSAGIKYEFGEHSEKVYDCDFMVISPGVPSNAPVVQKAMELGIKVWSEIEVASWFCKAPIIAVTGTNGKTTTTSLIGHIFKTAGFKTIVAGNIGAPFSDFVLDADEGSIVVLEVSSFQLDHIENFKPKVAVLLNITPDHLDRYDSFGDYILSKFRIFKNQKEDDFAVYNYDDEIVQPYVESLNVIKLPFSVRDKLSCGGFIEDGYITLNFKNKKERILKMNNLRIRGIHNVYNSLAAALAARAMEVKDEIIRESLQSFEGVEHRLEFVREINGVKFINDSKATNVNSLWYALESFDEPIILIAGGRDKGNDYSKVYDLVKRKVKLIIAIGESKNKIYNEFKNLTNVIEVDSMEEAVKKAYENSAPGDVVLLSPACASFDMFRDYEHRGEVFKKLVNEL